MLKSSSILSPSWPAGPTPHLRPKARLGSLPLQVQPLPQSWSLMPRGLSPRPLGIWQEGWEFGRWRFTKGLPRAGAASQHAPLPTPRQFIWGPPPPMLCISCGGGGGGPELEADPNAAIPKTDLDGWVACHHRQKSLSSNDGHRIGLRQRLVYRFNSEHTCRLA